MHFEYINVVDWSLLYNVAYPWAYTNGLTLMLVNPTTSSNLCSNTRVCSNTHKTSSNSAIGLDLVYIFKTT